MINANVTPGSNDYYKVEFIFPDGTGNTQIIRGYEEALRILYFKNRNYIASKLLAWIHQRKHALARNEVRISYVVKLETALEHYQHTPFKILCGFIHRNLQYFKAIAPPETSPFYPHYKKSILPILDFCDE